MTLEQTAGLREAVEALLAFVPRARGRQPTQWQRNRDAKVEAAIQHVFAALPEPEPTAREALVSGVTQSVVGDTNDSDCFPAAMSTITGLTVPNLNGPPSWFGDYQRWLREHGWALTDDDGTRPMVGFSVAVGTSPLLPHVNHAAVALDGVVIWDPSPHRDDPGREFRPRHFWPVFRVASGRPIYDPFAVTSSRPAAPELRTALEGALNAERSVNGDGVVRLSVEVARDILAALGDRP